MIDPGEVRGKIENLMEMSRQHNSDLCISKHVDTHMISDTKETALGSPSKRNFQKNYISLYLLNKQTFGVIEAAFVQFLSS